MYNENQPFSTLVGRIVQIPGRCLTVTSKCILNADVMSCNGIACFSTDGVCCGLSRLFVTFGGSGGIMTTARPGLLYICSPQAKTRDESSRRGK